MNDLLAVVLFLVAAAAAARSNWSPCGLSMLSSITPLGEAGRGHQFRSTARWFVAGATAGGAVLGALAAGGAVLVAAVARATAGLGPSSRVVTRLPFARNSSSAWVTVSAVICLLALAFDSGVFGEVIPVLRRQVNERWLDQFRSYVYGAGFGFQIGIGLYTYVMTAAVPALLLLAMLSANPLLAFGACTTFGALRGLTVLLGRSVTDTETLRKVHARLHAWREPVRLGVMVVLAIAAVVFAGSAGAVIGLGTAAASAALIAAGPLRQRRASRRQLGQAQPQVQRQTGSAVSS